MNEEALIEKALRLGAKWKCRGCGWVRGGAATREEMGKAQRGDWVERCGGCGKEGGAWVLAPRDGGEPKHGKDPNPYGGMFEW